MSHVLPTLAALVTSLGSLGLLLASFGSASPQGWLAATPDTRARVTQCDSLARPAGRDKCARLVVPVCPRQSLDGAVRAAAERGEQSPALFLALPASRAPADKPVLALQGMRPPHIGSAIHDTTLVGPVRVAVIGPNGCVKSTLLRVIVGALAPLQGSATMQVPFATLDQDGGDAPPHDSPLLERLRALDCPLPRSELRTRLAQLRLDAARVLLPLGRLSAGERLMAALACALWRREPPRLLLDQPTSDLDTTLVLQQGLQGFEGAIIVASHDPEFIDALRPTQRWEWRDGRLVMRQSSMARAARISATRHRIGLATCRAQLPAGTTRYSTSAWKPHRATAHCPGIIQRAHACASTAGRLVPEGESA